MIKNGDGGKNTQSGKLFENKTKIPNDYTNLFKLEEKTIFYKQIPIGKRGYKKDVYTIKNSFNESHKLFPDEFWLVENNLYIFEKKYQNVAGSVDEKLQTAHYKIFYWKKIFNNLNVKFCFILSEFFKNKKYKSVISYFEKIECHHSFLDYPNFVFEEIEKIYETKTFM